MNEILQRLNPDQLKPVLDTEGAVLVLAGAGSGKTRVLTSRIAYIVEEKGVYPSSVLAITFTNKAAKEMQQRLSLMIDNAESMWICTIHSMCVRILRMFADRLGYNKNFSIYSETERATVIKKSFQECEYDDDKLLKNVKWHIANAKMLGLGPEEYRAKNADVKGIRDICNVYDLYCRHLKMNNALDFDDLLTETLRLLSTDKEALEILSGRFRYIHVDEFQDTNAVQYEIVRLLSVVHGQPVRRGRRRSEHIRLARREDRKHSAFRKGLQRRESVQTGTKLPFHQKYPETCERSDQKQRHAHGKSTLDGK